MNNKPYYRIRQREIERMELEDAEAEHAWEVKNHNIKAINQLKDKMFLDLDRIESKIGSNRIYATLLYIAAIIVFFFY